MAIVQRNWIILIHQLMFSSKIIRKLRIIIKKKTTNKKKRKLVAAREKWLHVKMQKLFVTQSAWAVEYTDCCTSAEG